MPEPHPLSNRVNLGAGLHDSDLPMVNQRLDQLFARLEAWPAAMVDIWLRVKERDRPGMKTTLEVQVPGLPMLLANSKREPIAAGLDRAVEKMVRKLNEAVDKHGDRGRDTIRR